MECVSCGTQGDTPWCTQCGAPLDGAQCKGCSEPLVAGAGACGRCGAPTQAAKRNWLPLVAVLLIGGGLLLWQTQSPAPSPARPAVAAPAQLMPPMPVAPPVAAPPPSPRRLADQAFNAAMMADEAHEPQAAGLAEVALQAYTKAGALDEDGHFHVALLQLAAGKSVEAQATTDAMLAAEPDHLLALGVAIKVASSQGDRARALRYARHLIEVYPSQQGRTDVAGYRDHGNMLPSYQQKAQALLATP